MSYDWISFTTDYGIDDGFVAACEGVIARIAPGPRVLHVSHTVPAAGRAPRRRDPRPGGALPAGRRPPRRRRPGGGHRPPRDGPRRGRGAAGRAGQRAAHPRRGDARRGARRVRAHRARLPALPRVGDLPRPRRVRPRRRAPRRRDRAGELRHGHGRRHPRPAAGAGNRCGARKAGHRDPVGGQLRQHPARRHRCRPRRRPAPPRAPRRTSTSPAARSPPASARTFRDAAQETLLVYVDSAGRVALAVDRGSAAVDFSAVPGDQVLVLFARA